MSKVAVFQSAIIKESEDTPFKWSFHGNFVIPARNPFMPSIPLEEENHSWDVQWLDPGLKLCQEHLLIVEIDGILFTLLMHPLWIWLSCKGNAVILADWDREFLSPASLTCTFMLCNLPSPEQQQTDRSQEMFDSWRLTPFMLNNCFRMMMFHPSDEITKSLSTGITTACYFTTLHLEPCKFFGWCGGARCRTMASVGREGMHGPKLHWKLRAVNTTKISTRIELSWLRMFTTELGRNKKDHCAPCCFPW